MQVSNRPTTVELSKTFAVFLNGKPALSTALPLTETEEDKFERKYGMLYTGAALAGGAGLIYLLRRGGKLFNFTQFVKKHATRLTAKTLETLKNAKTSNFDFLERAKINTSIGVSNGLKKIEGLGNINPIKDITADKILEKAKLKPFFDKITAAFTSYGKKLAFSKYKAPQKDLIKLQQSLELAAQTISRLPDSAVKNQSAAALSSALRELSTMSGKELHKIVKEFPKRFDQTVKVLNANSEREFIETMTTLKGKSIGQKITRKLKDLGEFIPLKTMEPYGKKIFAPLNKSKIKISNSVMDLHKTLSHSVDDIFYDNSLHDTSLRASYLKLKDLTEKFKNPKKFNLHRTNVKPQIIEELQKAATRFNEINPNSEKAKLVNQLIETVSNDKKGAIEEAISACKVLKEYNPSLYMKLIAQRNKFQKSFNNAVHFETDKSFRKLLDCSRHSLTTDLFTQLAGLGTIGYILLNRKKTKEEKISANLKTGIPFAGGLLVAFLCNLRQVASGTGALLFAGLAGFILNRIGTVASKIYLKNKTSADNSTQIKG